MSSARLARPRVVPDRDDEDVLGLEARRARGRDLGVREQRQRAWRKSSASPSATIASTPVEQPGQQDPGRSSTPGCASASTMASAIRASWSVASDAFTSSTARRTSSVLVAENAQRHDVEPEQAAVVGCWAHPARRAPGGSAECGTSTANHGPRTHQDTIRTTRRHTSRSRRPGTVVVAHQVPRLELVDGRTLRSRRRSVRQGPSAWPSTPGPTTVPPCKSPQLIATDLLAPRGELHPSQSEREGGCCCCPRSVRRSLSTWRQAVALKFSPCRTSTNLTNVCHAPTPRPRPAAFIHLYGFHVRATGSGGARGTRAERVATVRRPVTDPSNLLRVMPAERAVAWAALRRYRARRCDRARRRHPVDVRRAPGARPPGDRGRFRVSAHGGCSTWPSTC